MADNGDKWFSLAKAGLFFGSDPQLDGRPSYGVIRHWADCGVVSKKTGKRVYLKTRQVGGRRKTCMEYWEKFIKELNPDMEGEDGRESQGNE